MTVGFGVVVVVVVIVVFLVVAIVVVVEGLGVIFVVVVVVVVDFETIGFCLWLVAEVIDEKEEVVDVRLVTEGFIVVVDVVVVVEILDFGQPKNSCTV